MICLLLPPQRSQAGQEKRGGVGGGVQLSAEPYEALPESIDLLQV